MTCSQERSSVYMAIIAVLVREWLGLSLLRKAWLNMVAPVATGVLLLLTSLSAG
jgi:hypothetical protein